MPQYHGFMQWKFTSCRYNIENSNGFNTYSMSEGLSREDKDDLIRYAGSYTPPDNLPYRPTQEEIDALFPVVFASFPLRSGKWGVTRSVYIGQDYAGVRWGNFFSHGIICPAGHWPFYPIRLWNSPLFANGLTTEEQQQHTPPPLPQLTIDEEDLHDFLSEIPRFLADLSIREQSLMPMLDMTRNALASGKTVLLRDTPAHIPVWIAAMQYAFPLRLASGISFTTFMHAISKSQRFHITGTSLEGHAIPMKSPSLNAACHVFDLPEERIATIPEASQRIYLERIRCDEATYPGGNLLELYPFIDTLECKLSDDSLDKSVLLYQYLFQPWQELPAPEVFKSILDFFSRQPLPVCLRLGIDHILKKNTLYTREMLKILFPHLLAIVVKFDVKPEIAQLFFQFLIKHFVRNIGPDNWKDSLERLELLETMLTQMPEDIKQRFFECVARYVDTSASRKQFLFLYLMLLLCLYANQEKAYRNYFDVFFDIPFSEQEFNQFITEIIDCLIDKAVTPVVYEQIVKLHLVNVPRNRTITGSNDDAYSKPYAGDIRYGNRETKHGKSEEELKTGKYYFIREYNYLEKLQQYQLVNWREGGFAAPQGVAFLRYVLGTYQKNREEWNAWVNDYKIVQTLFKLQTDNKPRITAFEKIREQLAKEKTPLHADELDCLKSLLKCKSWGDWFSDHLGLCIFLGLVAVLAIAFLVLLIWFSL